MTTDQIMEVALALAGLDAPTPDSMTHVPGKGIRKKILFGIDIGPTELQPARSLGFDCVS